MRRKSVKLFAAVVCAALMLAGVISASSVKANAGLEPSKAYETQFNDGPVSGGAWEYSGATVVTDEGETVGMRVENAGEGTGLMTNRDIVADKVTLEVDIEYLELNGGWLAFILGLDKTEAPILDWNVFGGGQYILLQNVGGNWYLVTQAPDKGYDLVDGDDRPIKDGDDAVSRRYNRLSALGNGATLENLTLSLSLDTDGNLMFTTRAAGQSKDDETVLAKTGGTRYEPYSAGRVGLCVMQGSRGVNAKFGDVKVFSGDKSEPETRFRFGGENVSSDYILDVGNNPNSLSFAAKGKLALTATDGADAYAVCKTPVYFDENVKDYSVKNISVSHKLFIGDGFDGSDAFYVYFGLINPYDTEIATDGTYALKIAPSGFSLVSYGDGGETEIAQSAAYESNSDHLDVSLSLDGDGTLSASVGETVAVAPEKHELLRRRTYTGFGLVGNAQVKVDDLTVINALYSRPNNKDLGADFDNGELNVREWYLPAWGGNIDDRYDGVFAENGELRFKDVNSNASITTIPQFSNFELKFDITDIKREGYVGSPFIGIMYGLESYKTGFNVAYIAEKRPFISFRPDNGGTNYSILNTENEISARLPSKYNMFSPAMDGKVFTVRLSVTDGLVKLCLKASGESDFTEIARIKESGSITGHIRINGYGDGAKDECSNFSIDNLSVKNTDKNPLNKNDYGYLSNKDWITWGGFEYVDTWKSEDLLPIASGNGKKGCSASVGISGGISAVVLLSAAAFMAVRRKKNEK